ncbi:MAG: hypothetical protein KGO52_13715 [Nitrospirota bacterium]|nr:hypothetical protein [Nitrospirota bacterium]MDE3119539.1 hypothetical protein [Nitrospirota bacterium]MDE3226717.1 hypothetical protein [Nitrospirota bacterium]MDE3243767.1 hypothetical protein [Nitrospirota bacterium]
MAINNSIIWTEDATTLLGFPQIPENLRTRLTFGTILVLYGLAHGLINQEQCAVLVTVVILSAVVPTVIAERWFDPGFVPEEERPEALAVRHVLAFNPEGPVQ